MSDILQLNLNYSIRNLLFKLSIENKMSEYAPMNNILHRRIIAIVLA